MDELKDHEYYDAISSSSASSSRPRELFDDLIEKMKEKVREVESIVKDFCKSSGITIKFNSVFESW